LFNSIDNGHAKQEFFNKGVDVGSRAQCITENEVVNALSRQKKGNSSGPNGIHMESLMFADTRLHVHLSLFFTFCLRRCYLPSAYMSLGDNSIKKIKGGDLADIDNYRAIAISNAETNLLETVMLNMFTENLILICINLDLVLRKVIQLDIVLIY